MNLKIFSIGLPHLPQAQPGKANLEQVSQMMLLKKEVKDLARQKDDLEKKLDKIKNGAGKDKICVCISKMSANSCRCAQLQEQLQKNAKKLMEQEKENRELRCQHDKNFSKQLEQEKANQEFSIKAKEAVENQKRLENENRELKEKLAK